MGKKNCWDVKGCGREKNGSKTKELGVCPAANCPENDQINSGEQGGRFCWAVTGTLCGGQVQGTFAQKKRSCMSCEFFRLVRAEEGSDFKLKK